MEYTNNKLNKILIPWLKFSKFILKVNIKNKPMLRIYTHFKINQGNSFDLNFFVVGISKVNENIE